MFEFHIITSSDHQEELSDQLLSLGSSAITFPEQQTTNDEVLIVAIFEDEEIAPLVQAFLETLINQNIVQRYEMKAVEQQDWLRACLDQLTPTLFGDRLWICPSWQTPTDPDAINVMIDPGHAFGTGTHPTTALCLTWLDKNIKGNEVILDYGCGSGILAIAALKLGAKKAIGIDNDEKALEASAINARENDVEDKLTLSLPKAWHEESVDILLANILIKPLIENAAYFASLVKPEGKIVLSGILDSQAEEISELYQNWFKMSPPIYQDEWVLIEGIKR